MNTLEFRGFIFVAAIGVALPSLSVHRAWAEMARGAAADSPSVEKRARARELGIIVGRMSPGKLDAITDVPGVLVGHVTINKGAGPHAARTGVTAILPHGGDLWNQKVPAAAWVYNGNGEMTGITWLNTQGALDVPLLLTNTMNIPRVADGVVSYMLGRYPDIGRKDDVVIPVVAECDDSALNDARGRHVSAEDAMRAIQEAKGGPVAEGSVGAGTGMITYGFKAGIGTASRVLPAEDGGWTVGVLVNSNVGCCRENLVMNGVPVGKEMPDLQVQDPADGSIIVVVATDAPLDHLKLRRLASKAVMGLARTGSTARHGSGDIFLAFSTGNRIPHYPKERTYALTVVDDDRLNPLFEAAEEATEEAILNALTAATTTTGRDGSVAHAIPLDRLKDALKKHSAPTR